MAPLCRIELLGGLRVLVAGRVLTHFRTRRTADLLAYLAAHLGRSPSREVLIDLLWPEADLESGRNRLRIALASLRRQLEPPGIAAGALLQADRNTVRLAPGLVTTDVAELRARLKDAARAPEDAERARCLTEALELYRGELLPDCYDEWVLGERARLHEQCLSALHTLTGLRERAGDLSGALDAAQRALALDPLWESSHQAVIRLHTALGQTSAAARQYQQLERILDQELGEKPSTSTQRLLEGATIDAQPAAAPPEETASNTTVPAAVLETPLEAAGPPRDRNPLLSAVLPVQATAFFGREREREQLAARLAPLPAGARQCRLLTLLGPGGFGKTRLAIEVATGLVEAYQGAVWFVPLAALAHARYLPEAIVQALGKTCLPEQDPLAIAAAHLAQKPSLLVLDNLEHLLPETLQEGGEEAVATGDAGATVAQLLARTPGLTCLTTSRRRLDVAAERLFPVPPLAVPDVQAAPPSPESISQIPSVQLFVDRAQALRPDFQITERNAQAIVQLCVRLEGMPLALELAAGRIQAMTPAHMVSELERRFEWLASRRRDLPERHRTLRSTLDWSWSLLALPLQRFFLDLHVFRGGWTPQAASLVCQEPDAPHYLEQLEALSLVQSVQSADTEGLDELRYTMLETVRQYCAERIPVAERASVEARHAHYFLALAQEADAARHRPGLTALLDGLEAEHDNLRAALASSLARQDGQTGLSMAAALAHFWWVRGHLTEGRDWLERSLALPGTESLPARARALLAASLLARLQGDYTQALRYGQESIDLFRTLEDQAGLAAALAFMASEVAPSRQQAGAPASMLRESLNLYEALRDDPGRASSLGKMGVVAVHAGRHFEATVLLEEALSLYQKVGDDWGISAMLSELGYQAFLLGQYPRAEALFEELGVLAERLRAPGLCAHVLWHRANVARARGNYAAAAPLLAESVRLRRQVGEANALATALHSAGSLAALQGDRAAAHCHFQECLALFRQQGERTGEAAATERLGWLAFWEGDLETAWTLASRARVMLSKVAASRSLGVANLTLGRVALARGDTASARQHLLESIRLSCHYADRRGAAECLEVLAGVFAAEGEAQVGARLLGIAQGLRSALGTPPSPLERAGYEALSANLAARLGRRVLDTLCAEGRTLSASLEWEAAIGSALPGQVPLSPGTT